ncbi:hypothetical protein [Corynebacterium argentoratense]|uniref:hypothetical protein n=1 Tax=Corynebacterium argentoratense TaxID=42817 RepID=UPI003C704E04
MGRHSTGLSPKKKVAPQLILALIATVVVVAVFSTSFYLWNGARSRAADERAVSDCIQGQLKVPVEVSPDAPHSVDDILDGFVKANPVVKDYCIELTRSTPGALLITTGNTSTINYDLDQRGMSPAQTEWAVVAASRVGVGVRQGAKVPKTWADVAPDSTAYNGSFSLGPRLAAVLVRESTDTIDAALGAVADGSMPLMFPEEPSSDTSYILADEDDKLPDGFDFHQVADTVVPFYSVALNAGGGISEEQARVASAIQGYVLSQVPVQLSAGEKQSIVDLDSGTALSRALALGGGQQQDGSSADASESSDTGASAPAHQDTLLLLDTSTAMAEFLPAQVEALKKRAAEVVSNGHKVALWNYSSPLNPGVTQGWRNNVAFTDDLSLIDATLDGFQTGGLSQTRPALINAMQATADHGGGQVYLVTTGSVGFYDDDSFSQMLDAFNDSAVTVAAQHVGPGAHDKVLDSFIRSQDSR